MYIEEGAFDKYKNRKGDKQENNILALYQLEESAEVKKKTNITRKTNNRMSPLKNVVQSLTNLQNEKGLLRQMGFGDYTEIFDFFYVRGILGMWVVENFNRKTCSLEMQDERLIKITRELIHDVLGILMGDIPVPILKE